MERKIEKVFYFRRVIDRDARCTRADTPISQAADILIAGHTHGLLEVMSVEDRSPDGAAESDANKERRSQAPGRFYRACRLRELARSVGPPSISPCEERNGRSSVNAPCGNAPL